MNQRLVLASAAAAALLVALLAGCGDDTVARSEPGVDELAQHDGEPCPDTLEQGSGEAAGDAPEPAEPDEAWVCRYDPTDTAGAGDGGMGWTRVGEPVPVDPEALTDLMTALEDLEPASTDDRICTMDLGPRYLLVLSDAGDLTGITADSFGCRDVRLTDEPFETAPGEGEFPGVFTGPADLVEDLRALSGD